MSTGNTTLKMDFNGKVLIFDDGKLTFLYEEPRGCVLFFFRKAKTYSVTIDPNTKMVTAENRKIPEHEDGNSRKPKDTLYSNQKILKPFLSTNSPAWKYWVSILFLTQMKK